MKNKAFMNLAIIIFGVFLALIFFARGASAQTYYVANAGNDACDGTSSTIGTSGACAWQTIAKVNASTFQPGDSILFNKGDTWREQLTVPSSGTDGHPITFGAYGDSGDPKPIINGSDVVTGWTQGTAGSLPVSKWLCENTSVTDSAGLNTLSKYGTVAVTTPLSPAGSHALSFAATAGANRAVANVDSSFPFKTTIGDFTIGGWVNFPSPPASFAQFFKFTNATSGFQFLLDNGTSKKFRVNFPGSTGNLIITSDSTLTPGTAYHVVIRNTSGLTEMFVDGVKQANTGTLTNPVLAGAGSYLQMGGGSAVILDEWFAFNVALTDAQINNIKTGSGLFPPNVWGASLTTEPSQVFINGTRGIKETSIANLNATNEWYWDSNILYTYSTVDPTGLSIEASIRNYAINITDKSDITIDGSDCQKAVVDGIKVTAVTTASLGITIRNCKGSYNWGSGFRGDGRGAINYTASLLIEDSEADHNGMHGVFFGSYTHDITIRRVTSHHNAQDGTQAYMAGIRICNAPTAPDARSSWGILIENCISYSEGKNDAGTIVSNAQSGQGIWLDTVGDNGGSDPDIVRYNQVYNCANTGLSSENTINSLWYYNISYNNTGYGLFSSCSLKDYPNDSNKFYNNVIYGNNIGIFNAGKYQETSVETAINNIFKNNIAAGNTTTQLKAGGGGENLNTADGHGSGNVYTYNSFGPQAAGFIIWRYAYTKSTYSDWETAYGGTTHSIQSNPQFVNPTTDFHLQPTSLAINAGTDVGLTTDYTGTNKIYGLPDLGAYEYQPPYDSAKTTPDPIDIGAGARIYGDGKFENIGLASGTTANLSVVPQSSDTTKWLDITAPTGESDIVWETNHKKWKESSTTLGNTDTLHTVGDLTAGKSYTLRIDNSLATGNITGSDCTAGVCMADGSNQITFTYTGGYTDHTFDLTDDIPPVITINSPTAGHTVSADDTIDFTDSEHTNPQCSLNDTDYDDCEALSTSFSQIPGWNALAEKDTFILYIKDTDSSNNTGTAEVDNLTKADTQAPIRSDKSPDGELESSTTQTTISLKTDENATCRYNTTPQDYTDMTAFTTTGGTTHSQTITNLTSGTSYSYYVNCRDGSGNTNDTDYRISFSIAPKTPKTNTSDKNSNNDNTVGLNVHKVKAESTENTLTITWKTDHNSNSRVRYGTDKNLEQSMKNPKKEKDHKITLANLTPGTKYYFRVRSANSETDDSSRIYTATTQSQETTQSLAPAEPTPQPQTDNVQSQTDTTPSSSATPNTCSYTVESGDTLWGIARTVYGDATAYSQIIDCNKGKYPDIGDKLAIGEEFTFCDSNANADNTQGQVHGATDQAPEQNPAPAKKQVEWWNPFSWF